MKRSLMVVVLALCALMALGATAYGAPEPPYDTNSKCLECHSVAGTGAFTKVDFEVPGAVDYNACRACHAGTVELYGVVLQFEEFAYHEHFEYSECQGCHGGQLTPNLPQVKTPFGWFVSWDSLYTSPQELHQIHVIQSTNVIDTYGLSECMRCHGNAACSSCHTAEIGHDQHALPDFPPVTYAHADGSTYSSSAVICVNAACHSLMTIGSTSFAEPSCSGCHTAYIDPHGYDNVDHVADDQMLHGIACSACHALDLETEHLRYTSASSACATCHPTPRDTVGAWDQGCVTGGCHTAASTAPFHADEGVAHEIVPAGAMCLDCHSGSDLASVHVAADDGMGNTSCLVCHSAAAAPASNDCTVCHFTFEGHYAESSHLSTWTLDNCNSAGCHSSRDLMAVHNDHRTSAEGEFACSGCHSSTDASVVSAIADGLTGCGDCHAGVSEIQGHRVSHWANPLLQDASGPKYSYYTGSAGTQPTGDCAMCHTSNIIDEHMGLIDAETGFTIRLPRKDSTGNALTCGSCHNSGLLNVQSAILNGFTNCDSCHIVHGPIQVVHTSTFLDEPIVDCASCHDANIAVEHNGAFSVVTPGGEQLTGCDVCHSYYEAPRGTEIQAAITGKDARCTACHSADHPDLGSHTASTATSLDCGSCHADGLMAIDVRAVHSGAPAGACAVCHSNPSRVPDIFATTAECSSCHATEGTDYHGGLPAKHTYVDMDSSCVSAGCHVSNMLPEAHEPYLAGSGYSSTCALCHQNSDPDRIPVGATAACDSCHEVHGDIEVLHTAPDSQECVDCHKTADVRVLHDDCATCHNSTVDTSGTTACVNCHGYSPAEEFHYDTSAHTAAETGCDGCHYTTMEAEHNRGTISVSCVECHSTKVDEFTGPWDMTCAACHSMKHGNKATKHVSTMDGCSGSGCHNVGDVADLHKALPDGGCSTCHVSPDSPATTTTCSAGGCHEAEGVDYHSGLPVKHTYADMDSSCLGAGCHASNMLPEAHESYLDRYEYTSTCALCHGNSDPNRIPAGATAACDSCHEVHGDIEVLHTAPDSQECVDCHRTADVRVLHDDCATCHNNTVDTSGTTACVNCHGYSPAEEFHYSADAHLADETGCDNCHYLDMDDEHTRAHINVTCVQCHTTKVDQFTSAWDMTCAACHPIKHQDQATKHTSSMTGCGGSGCHNVGDVADIHKALPDGGCSACHKSPDSPANTTDCSASGCHINVTGDHHAAHDGRDANGTGCEGCHFRYLDDEHAALGMTCATCHASTDTVVRGAITSGDRRCLTCHPDSAHNARQATEFSAGNASMHRVTADLPGMRSSFLVNGTTYTMSIPGASTFLKSGWQIDSIVTCDTCHTYSGATGPHGATMKVNIDPAYPNPYKVVNGSESFTAQLSANSPTGMSMSKNGSSRANIICEKCHVLKTSSGSWSNVAHKEHDDRGREGSFCNQCHVAIPHGWGRPRLLGYVSDPAPYRTWVGTSGAKDGGLARVTLKNYTPSNWGKSDCGAGCSSSRHPLSGSSWPNIMNQAPAMTTGTVSGKVTDSSTGAAISGATVALSDGKSTSTSSGGNYSMVAVDEGTYTLTVSATGYNTWSGSVTVTAGQTRIANVALVATSSGAGVSTNLALSGTATASSTDGSDSPSRAIDGNTSSYWRSRSGSTQWLRVDLGSSKGVSKIVINWDGSRYARAYRVETSSDGSNWTTRYSTTSASSGTKTHTFSAVDARYVRLYCTSANDSHYRVREFEIWNF